MFHVCTGHRPGNEILVCLLEGEKKGIPWGIIRGGREKTESREELGGRVQSRCAEGRKQATQKKDRSGDAGTTKWECRREEECKGHSWSILG